MLFDGAPCAVNSMCDAAELKWHDYRDDNNFIAVAKVTCKNGKPQLTVTVKGENPELDALFEEFRTSIPQKEIEEYLKTIPPDRVQDELIRIMAEYLEQFSARRDRKSVRKALKSNPRKNAYIFRVSLIDDKFYCDILMCWNQTFEDLHEIIFEAFRREEEHLYFFDVGGTRISAPECDFDNDELDASKTQIQDMAFEEGDCFNYLFDYGAECQHGIEVRKVLPFDDSQKYPHILNCRGVPPPQYYNEEPFTAIHPELVRIIRKKCPEWDGDEYRVYVDEYDSISEQDVSNFIRGKILIFVLNQNNRKLTVRFSSLKELFRKSSLSEAEINHLFLSMVRNAVLCLAEHGLVSRIDNTEFLKIFSAMSRVPDTPSQSFLHDILWTVTVCFLLQYECSIRAFSKCLRWLCRNLKKSAGSSFYDFCLANDEEESYEEE